MVFFFFFEATCEGRVMEGRLEDRMNESSGGSQPQDCCGLTQTQGGALAQD